MAVEYCQYCDQYIDLDYCVEHFPDAYWEKEGEDAGKCQVEVEDDHWAKQAQWGDFINKDVKENPRVNIDPDTGRDRR